MGYGRAGRISYSAGGRKRGRVGSGWVMTSLSNGNEQGWAEQGIIGLTGRMAGLGGILDDL
jgi:hypothetical protein